MTVNLGLNYIDKYKENSVTTTKTQLFIPVKTKVTRKIKVIHRLGGACAQLCQILCNSLQIQYCNLNTGVGCHFLLQGIFPTQGSNQCLLHCRQILYPLSHWASPSHPLLLLNWQVDSLPLSQMGSPSYL